MARSFIGGDRLIEQIVVAFLGFTQAAAGETKSRHACPEMALFDV